MKLKYSPNQRETYGMRTSPVPPGVEIDVEGVDTESADPVRKGPVALVHVVRQPQRQGEGEAAVRQREVHHDHIGRVPPVDGRGDGKSGQCRNSQPDLFPQ